jgi:hypothetical protein
VQAKTDNHSVTVEAPSLKECRAKAVEALKLPAERLKATVLQYGKQGWFTDRPFRVRFVPKERQAAEPKPNEAAMDRIDQFMGQVRVDLDVLDSLGRDDERLTFEQVLEHYEELDEDVQKELRDLAGFMREVGGDDAREVIDRVSRDGTFELRVSEDRMAATLHLTPPKGQGRAVTAREVMEHLAAEGIRHGVDIVRIREAVQAAADAEAAPEPVRIAAGTPPGTGSDGRVRLLVSGAEKELTLAPDGRADYRGKAAFSQVEADDLLARILPPEPGADGQDIFGTVLPGTPGTPACLAAGENTYWNTERTGLHAAITGVVEVREGQVSVRQLVLVRGDVDMKTGNIDFDGEVEVMGSVRDHFYVRATGDIRIRGRVEGAEVVSTKGSVTIEKGIVGRNRCHVSAATTVETRYIENGTAYAGTDLLVDRAILNSRVVAGRSILLRGGKAMLAGGSASAGETIEAKHVGNVNEPHTRIHLGVAREDYERIEKIDRQIAAYVHAIGRIDAVLEQVTGFSRNLSGLPREKRQEFVRLKKQTIVLKAKTAKLVREKRALETSASRQGHGILKAFNTLYGRVEIHMAGESFMNEKERRAVAVRYDPEKGEIVVRGDL